MFIFYISIFLTALSPDDKINPVDTLLKDADAFFYGGNHWQAGLLQLVKELSYEQALWKPSEERHCIWEIVRHINFWKRYAVAYISDRVMPDADTGNWTKATNELKADDWKNELEELELLHEELKQTIMKMGNLIIDNRERKSNYLRTILYHDCYHSGQIGLLRVMQGLKPIE
jgi:hypothetical protein